VRDQLADRIAIIVDGGPSPRDVASTIVNLSEGGWRLLREGAIPRQAIADTLGGE
jgi:tRNA A37 threonylcarbamoyladenosine synthetase subunit TsaC/SUA5/YrdC